MICQVIDLTHYQHTLQQNNKLILKIMIGLYTG